MKNVTPLFYILFCLLVLSTSLPAKDLRTVAEKSNWLKTGRADEVAKLCRDFSKQYPKRIKCQSYGVTPEGRTLWFLNIHDVKPKAHSPTVWLQAGIHAGEIDGKDAVFQILNEAFVSKSIVDPFLGLNVVFVPIVNLDGHERFGKWNRPNQIGPDEMGWRTTAQNYNLNRDFTKLDSSEMRDLNSLWNKYDPIVSLDLHVTDGAKFRPEVGIIVTPNESHGSSPLHRMGQEFENKMIDKMKARGRAALPFYPSFEKDEDPLSGFSKGVSPPRFSNGYWFVRNRIGVLIESHSWKNYATRVKIHHDTVLSALESVRESGSGWIKVANDLDRSNLASKKIDLSFKHTDKSKLVAFEGYTFTIQKSKISGGNVVHYFEDKPEAWNVPFYDEVVPVSSVVAPDQGYFIPASEMEWMKKKLDVHGIKYQSWKKEMPKTVGVFRASKTQLSPTSFEGHQNLTVEGNWQMERVKWPAQVYFVPINQPGGLIAMHLLEPSGPDSFLSWGFFNRMFEIKEYMEDYVAEDMATEMLASHPDVAKEFAEQLKDESFAKDAGKRFRYFHQKHSSWDDHYNRYPIMKL